jgi:hypothetical protein
MKLGKARGSYESKLPFFIEKILKTFKNKGFWASIPI